MPKVKPILVFIITSVALHWWILSLPIFKRIQILDSHNTKSPLPTVIAHLSQDQPVVKTPPKTDKETTENLEADQLNKPVQELPKPSFFRGSPWMRRPAELRPSNPGTRPSVYWLTQVNQALQNEDIEQEVMLECKRTGIERLFKCLGSSNSTLTIKIEKVLNQTAWSSVEPTPTCVSLEELQKKWHAKACHS